MNRHNDYSNSCKRKTLIGTGLQFRGLVYFRHFVKHGSTQADIGLEMQLRAIQHLDLQVVGKEKDTGLN